MPQTDARGVASLGVAPDPSDVAVQVTAAEGPVVGAEVRFYTERIVPVSIAADGLADASLPLMEWLATVPDYTTIRFSEDTVYRLDWPVRLIDRWGLKFACDGARFVAGPEPAGLSRHALRTHGNFYFQGGGQIVFSNPRVLGRNPYGGTHSSAYDADREAQHGFWVAGVNGFQLESPIITDLWGDCVYLGPDLRPSRFAWTRDAQIFGGEMARTGRQGIAIVAAEDVEISGVYLHSMRRATFNVEPTSANWGARRVRIIGNRTGAARLLWLSSLGQGWNVSDLLIQGNVMETTTGVPVIYLVAPVGGHRGPNIVIEGNKFRVGGSPAPAFRIDRMRGVTIRDNDCTFPAARAMTAVRLTDAQDAVIENNRFCGAAVVVASDALSTYIENDNVTACV